MSFGSSYNVIKTRNMIYDDGLIVLQQDYSVRFQNADALPRTTANLVNRSRSGNPGYIFGRPVLAGEIVKTTAEQNVISARSDGLKLFGAVGDGLCTISNNYMVHCDCSLSHQCAFLACRLICPLVSA